MDQYDLNSVPSVLNYYSNVNEKSLTRDCDYKECY